MKKDIHPQYYPNAKVVCACGNTWETGSTQNEIRVEICSACHPFYTGKQKLVDTARRVEKFQERVAIKDALAKERRGRKAKKETRASKRKSIAEKLEIEKLETKGRVNKETKETEGKKKGNGSTKLTTGKINKKETDKQTEK